MRLLVTSMGSTASQNLVWALRRDCCGGDWFVVGSDMQAVHGGMDMPDVSVTLPSGHCHDYLEVLRSRIEEYEIDVLIPVMETELFVLARADSVGCPMLLSARRAIDVSRSKQRLAERFEVAGLDPPRVLDPGSGLSYPVFVRPDQGSGSHGARRVVDADGLRRALAAQSDLVVTEYVEGEEYSVDGFADRDGAVVHAICRRRDDVRHGLAVSSAVVELDSGLRRRIDALSRDLGLFGFFNVQFRREASARARFFDLNPRLGGAMALSFAAGLDAPRLLRRAFLGVDGDRPYDTRAGLQLRRRHHNVIVAPNGE